MSTLVFQIHHANLCFCDSFLLSFSLNVYNFSLHHVSSLFTLSLYEITCMYNLSILCLRFLCYICNILFLAAIAVCLMIGDASFCSQLLLSFLSFFLPFLCNSSCRCVACYVAVTIQQHTHTLPSPTPPYLLLSVHYICTLFTFLLNLSLLFYIPFNNKILYLINKNKIIK